MWTVRDSRPLRTANLHPFILRSEILWTQPFVATKTLFIFPISMSRNRGEV